VAATMSAPVARERSAFGYKIKGQLGSIGFVVPAFLVYAVFVLWPFLNTIYLSFTDWDGAEQTKNWVGLENYRDMLDDSAVWGALKHNIIWIVLGTFVPIFISLVLATVVWSKVKGTTFFRVVYFMPVVLAPTVVGVVWRWIYHPLFGPINKVLDAIGLDSISRGWLGDPDTALYAILFAAIWAYFGFAFVILTAALGNIDDSLIEAATLDGANAVQRFFHVIIPQLAPVLTMLTAFTLINGFNVFDIVWAMTLSAPTPDTEVLATYVYETAFNQSKVGYGSAVTMLITVLSLVASFLVIYLRERDSEVAS
jgi:ABC-type sugar transport system permease subunit